MSATLLPFEGLRKSGATGFVEDMETAGYPDILNTTYDELVNAVDHNVVVFLGPGDRSNEKDMIERAGEKAILIDPSTVSRATAPLQCHPVDYTSVEDILEARPSLADARTLVVIIWPPPQPPRGAEEGPVPIPFSGSTFDADVFDQLNVVAALVLYSHDGSSGSRELVELIDGWGTRVSLSVAKYGRGYGLAGQQIKLVALATDYDGPLGGTGTVEFPPDAIVASLAANLVSNGVHTRMDKVLHMWDEQLTDKEKLLIVLAVQKEVEGRRKLMAETARLMSIMSNIHR